MGNAGFSLSQEASAEGRHAVSPEHITVSSQGDRMRFGKVTRNAAIALANSVWEVKTVSVTVSLSDGKQTRTLNPKADEAQRRIDPPASSPRARRAGLRATFAIALEGVEKEGARRWSALESAYGSAVARMKQHAHQVYTDNREGWTTAVSRSREGEPAHMTCSNRKHARAVRNAGQLWSSTAAGCETAARPGCPATAVRSGRGRSPGSKFISPGKNNHQPHVACQPFDKNSKEEPVSGSVR